MQEADSMTNEELSLKTKQSLASALKDAMGRKMLSKITVSELAAACNVNRKTFYYHFQDIYSLLKWMLEQESAEVKNTFGQIVSAEDALRFTMDYVDKNKHIINGILDSMGHEEIKQFFYNDLFSVIYKAIEHEEQKLGVTVEEQFKNFLAGFYTKSSADFLSDWAASQQTQDKEKMLQNFLSIFQVSIPAILKANDCQRLL